MFMSHFYPLDFSSSSFLWAYENQYSLLVHLLCIFHFFAAVILIWTQYTTIISAFILTFDRFSYLSASFLLFFYCDAVYLSYSSNAAILPQWSRSLLTRPYYSERFFLHDLFFCKHFPLTLKDLINPQNRRKQNTVAAARCWIVSYTVKFRVLL